MEKAGGAIFKLKRQAKALITNINSFISGRYAVMLADRFTKQLTEYRLKGMETLMGRTIRPRGERSDPTNSALCLLHWRM